MGEDDLENINTLQTVAQDSPNTEFYNQSDSIYIRLQYFEDTDMFRFEVKQPIINKYREDEELPRNIMSLLSLVRGMLEITLQRPQVVATIGSKAINNEIAEQEMEGMSEEQRDLLRTPQGTA